MICVRQLYSPEWVTRIRAFLDSIMATASAVPGPRGETSFRQDLYAWLTNDELRDFVLFAPGAHIVQQALRSQRVNFYSDQIFVKDKLSPLPTPWHHGLTFWPMAGDQISSQ